MFALILLSLSFCLHLTNGWNPQANAAAKRPSTETSDDVALIHVAPGLSDTGIDFDEVATPVKSRDFRRQTEATNNAKQKKKYYQYSDRLKGDPCIEVRTLPADINEEYLAVDHVIELQFVAEAMNTAGVALQQYPASKVDDLRDYLNGPTNVAYIPGELNCYKKTILGQMTKELFAHEKPTCMTFNATAPLNIEIVAYYRFFCDTMMKTANDLTEITESPKVRRGRVKREKLDVANYLSLLLNCMGIRAEEDDEGNFTCDLAMPCH